MVHIIAIQHPTAELSQKKVLDFIFELRNLGDISYRNTGKKTK